jgi:hypothetical protein
MRRPQPTGATIHPFNFLHDSGALVAATLYFPEPFGQRAFDTV